MCWTSARSTSLLNHLRLRPDGGAGRHAALHPNHSRWNISVKICVVPSKRYGDRYACVKVEVIGEKPVRYELAMTGKEELDEELKEGDYFGFGVDAGWAVWQTSRPRQPSRPTGPNRWRKTRTSTPTTTCSATFWKKTPKPIPNINRAMATGSTGRYRTPAAICHLRLRLGRWLLSGLLWL